MSTPATSRRHVLQLLSGVPLLPLSSALAGSSVLLTACGGSDAAPSATAATLQGVSFSSMAAPTLATPAEMATTHVASTMTVRLSDGTARSYDLAYQPFFITGTLSLIHI